MTLMVWRLTKLQEEGSMTHGLSSSIKAWTTLRGRETVALGREILGGNGVTTDFHVAKAFCDMEAVYSYEGIHLPYLSPNTVNASNRNIRCQCSGERSGDHRRLSNQATTVNDE